MSNSIQVTSQANNSGAAQSKVSLPESGINQESDDDSTGFTAVFAQYSESDVTEDKINENISELLNELLPSNMLEDGNSLPESDNAVMWQAFMQLMPAENVNNNTVASTPVASFNLLQSQRPPLNNPKFLTQDYFQVLANQNKELNSTFQNGQVNNLISNQLAAAQFNPETNEAFILNTNEQVIPVQAGNSSTTNALAAVGFGTATQAAITQTQMQPLNLGQNAWETSLGSRLQMLVGQNVQTAEIRLDPPELGALDIKIKISNDIATVNISSPNAQVREALETAVPRLREMFEENGVALGDVNVRQESFTQRENETGDEGKAFTNASDSGFIEEEERVNQRVVSNSLLDIYA